MNNVTADFQTQLTSIMEMLAKTAIVEIGKLFEENSLFLRLEISRCTNENESLKKKCHFLENELKSGRKSAGKMNGTEAPYNHPGLNVTGDLLIMRDKWICFDLCCTLGLKPAVGGPYIIIVPLI